MINLNKAEIEALIDLPKSTHAIEAANSASSRADIVVADLTGTAARDIAMARGGADGLGSVPALGKLDQWGVWSG